MAICVRMLKFLLTHLSMCKSLRGCLHGSQAGSEASRDQGSSLNRTFTQGLKIIEEKELPFH